MKKDRFKYYIVSTEKDQGNIAKFVLWLNKDLSPYISWWNLNGTMPEAWRGLTYEEAQANKLKDNKIIDEDEFKRLRIRLALT